MTNTRKRRGADTQRIVATAWQQDGWPYAEPVGAGACGADLTGTPGVACEIKARANLDLTGWLRQACRNAKPGTIPVLIVRPNGYGEATVDDWPAVLPHGVLRALLRAAGYGNTPQPLLGALRPATGGGNDDLG